MAENSSKKAQSTVNERLKFLIDSLNMSARAFSSAIEMPDSNTRNYLTRGTKLNSDYLESIARRFNHVNLGWLITGQGEPFLTDTPPAAISHSGDFNITGNAVTQKVKVNKGQAQDIVKQLDDCQRDVEGLRRELALANALIASKDETISLLRIRFDRPN